MTVANLVSLPVIFMVGTAAGGYINTQIVFLLRDPEDGFNVPDTQLGVMSSSILFYSILVTLIFSPLMGYTFDMFGRRPVIMINFALMCIFVAVIPWTAPSIVMLGIMRAGLALAMAFFHGNPLLIDYVKKESRGKATAL